MRDKLIQSSIELFEKQGFAETSIQDIVSGLGVTKGAFYYHFPSKEALLLQIHQRFIDALLRRQHSILESAKTCSEKLREVVLMLLQNIEQNGASARVFFRELQNIKEENLPGVLEKRDSFRKGISDLIRAGMKSGEFRGDLHPDMTALGILGMCNWSYMWFNPGGLLQTEELAVYFTGLILSGIVREEQGWQ
ncbi:TetR/AcrR family transcriptional regulator [Ectobacillus ponti]|uniref:TetR/AcrR family transcriptional regulator n=1 Tax=Ectobacillus ponti TaxID=2961894 RepID=A0AA41X8U4_9BACI|nr:TetR/AcrR family transcriptional regulator [Ectobacillus ponti]MCP8969005.1 TetR/AcrR family transcriptional regulator [Ectobacillus ponti]